MYAMETINSQEVFNIIKEIVDNHFNNVDKLTDEHIKFTEQLTDSLSYHNLAFIHYNRIRRDKNVLKAIELYEKSTDISYSCNSLGRIYQRGIHPEGQNIPMAVKMYEKAFEMKNTYSMINLASLYYEGTHPDGRNIPKAIELYEKAIKLGNISAMNDLASLYENEQNYEKAVELYKKAIEFGNENASNSLALMYVNGTHPDGRNLEKAIELLEKVVETNDETILYNLASFYEDKQNYEKAIELYEKAAFLKEEYSIKSLESLYEKGIYKHESYVKLYENFKDTLKKPKTTLSKIYQDISVDTCPICYDPFIGTISPVLILTCGHVYHYDCINKSGMKCALKC